MVRRLAREAGVKVGTARAYLEGRWVSRWARARLDEAGRRLEEQRVMGFTS